MNKKILYGGDYNPEQWLHMPEILEKDIEYMKEAGINTVTFLANAIIIVIHLLYIGKKWNI